MCEDLFRGASRAKAEGFRTPELLMKSSRLKDLANSRSALVTGVALATAATAAWTEFKARRAEREHPPQGLFTNVDGIRLHYIDRGAGPTVVLLHGNAVTLEDFNASSLIERLAKRIG